MNPQVSSDNDANEGLHLNVMDDQSIEMDDSDSDASPRKIMEEEKVNAEVDVSAQQRRDLRPRYNGQVEADIILQRSLLNQPQPYLPASVPPAQIKSSDGAFSFGPKVDLGGQPKFEKSSVGSVKSQNKN